MSQENAYRFLKQNKGQWFGSEEMREKMNNNISICSLNTNLVKLHKSGFIERKQERMGKPCFYRCR